MDIDEVFQKIGEFGSQQKRYYFLLCLLNTYASFHMIQLVFTGADPTFSCIVENSTIYENSCPNGSLHNCNKVIYMDKFTSIATEWNLICDGSYELGLAQSLYMGGVMVGAFLLGPVSDAFGRLKTMFLSLLGMVSFGIASSSVSSYTGFIIARFFVGVCCAGNILATFVLMSELVGSSQRAFCGTVFQVFFALGIVIYSAMAWAIPGWRMLTLVSAASGSFLLLLYFYIPESPRWLLTHGRSSEAKEILQFIGKKNGNSIQKPFNLQAPSDSKYRKEGMTEICKHRILLLRTLVQMYSWFVNSAVYYGLTMAASALGDNRYVATALSGLIEVPAYFLTIYLLQSVGRRWSLCGFMVLGGISCLGVQLLPHSKEVMVNAFKTGMALSGKLGIAASFAVVYIHSAELFPTTLRNSGMGLVSVAARIGGIVSPFLAMLGHVFPDFQYTVFGLLSLSSGILNLWLPETLNAPLPETVQDLLIDTKPTARHSSYKPLPSTAQRIVLLSEKDDSSEEEIFSSESKASLLKTS